jgi:transcription elongation GreA/GreB family factor
MSTIQMSATDLEVPAPSPSGEEVAFGSTVSFTDQRAGRDQTFKIVASYEAKPHEGTLSIASPVALALLRHKAGDLVEVHTPRGPRPLLITAVA